MSVRVGVVGLGTMGRSHARNVEELGHEVVAGVDIAAPCRESFGGDFDAATYEHHEGMLADTDVDAVVITTPNRFHEEIAVGALERDCGVLVEKPLAHSVESAERIAAAADRSEGFCMVGFHNRFSPAAVTAKSYAERGRFGDVRHVEANYVRRRGIPGPGTWFTDESLSGGGALIDIGVHVLDLVLHLLDFPEVVEVVGNVRNTFGSRPDYADPEGWSRKDEVEGETFEVDDAVSAFLRCDSGETISLEVAWATNRKPTRDVVLRGTQAGAHMEVGGDEFELLEADTAGVDHYVTSTVSAGPERTGLAAEDECFLEGVTRGEAPPINTVEEGLAVQRVIDAIYESSESHRAVQLAETLSPVTAD